MERFTVKKRTALDGRVWWCVYDNASSAWSTYLFHGRYPTRKEAQQSIARSEIFFNLKGETA